MSTVNLSETSAESIAKANRIADKAGVNLRDCYQCGKCSAGCPMADGMDYPPQQIIHMLQMGFADKALSARSPWLCVQCSTCSSRCPQNIEVTDLMKQVRRMSHEEGRNVVPESEKFENLFIAGVRSKGKSNEQYLAAKYNFASGHLMQDVAHAPKMVAKGMIGIAAHSSKNPSAVKRLVDRCAEMPEPEEGGR